MKVLAGLLAAVGIIFLIESASWTGAHGEGGFDRRANFFMGAGLFLGGWICWWAA